MAKMSFNEWPAITADDATIKAALEEANIPALMAALAHLTGSTAILRGVAIEVLLPRALDDDDVFADVAEFKGEHDLADLLAERRIHVLAPVFEL